MIYVDGFIVGVIAGGVYSLIAISITLMFRSTGVLSFAHAAFAMLAAYLYTDFATYRGWSPWLSALLAVVITVAYGLVVERTVIRAVSHASAIMKLIATLGVLSVTSGVMLLRYGFQPLTAKFLLSDSTVNIGKIGVSRQQIAVLVVAAVLALAVGTFLRRAQFGIAVRAAAQNRDSAQLVGVSLQRVAAFNWGLGALLSALGGVLLAPLVLVSPGIFPLLLVKSLTASLFGGLMSLPLTFAGGLLVGVVEVEARLRFPSPGSPDLAVLVLVLFVLFVRRSWAVSALEDDTFGAGAANRGLSQALDRGVDRIRRALTPVAIPAAIAAGFLVILPARSEYWGFVGARALFYVIEALSLVILVGWGGQVSFMNGAYVGIGAFFTAYFSHVHGMNLELSLVLAALVGTGIGALAGIPALRLTGLQFAIASMAFSGAISQWLFQRRTFVDPRARQVPRDHLLGIDITHSGRLYLIMLVVTALIYFIAWSVRRSTYGSSLIASRDNPLTVAHFGTSPNRTRMTAFLLASFIGSLGGGFYIVLVSSAAPGDFALGLSIALLLYTVVGGAESLAGPLIAGVVFGVLPQVLQRRSGAEASAWPDVLSGVLVVALVALRPAGLASLFGRPGRSRAGAPGGAALFTGRFERLVTPRTGLGNGALVANGRHLPPTVGEDDTAPVSVPVTQEVQG